MYNFGYITSKKWNDTLIVIKPTHIAHAVLTLLFILVECLCTCRMELKVK